MSAFGPWRILTIDAKLEGFKTLRRKMQKFFKHELPATSEAVETATDMIQQEWIALASGVRVTYSGGQFTINRVSGQYVRSIEDGKEYPYAGDPYIGRVVALAKHAYIIETGITPFDMKPGLLKGRPYVTIAFRHGTPGTVALNPMSDQIYEKAKLLAQSQVLRPKMHGTKGQYKWGERLDDPLSGQRTKMINRTAKYTWKTGQYHGMVRFRNEVGGSTYVTFRRVSRNSDDFSWMHPGVKPRPIREVVIERTRDRVLELIRTGFMLDMQSLGIEHF